MGKDLIWGLSVIILALFGFGMGLWTGKKVWKEGDDDE